MRAYDFKLDTENCRPFHYTRHPYITRFFNSISLLFPNGERWFMNSIRTYESQLTEELLEEAKVFYKEEGRHSREHMKLNALLKANGYDTAKLEAQTQQKLEALGTDPEMALMITVALEILTANGADLLKVFEPVIFDDSSISDMWRWHMKEEAGHGHRTIAHKVLEHVNPNYSRIKLAFVFVLSLVLIIAQTMSNYKELSKF